MCYSAQVLENIRKLQRMFPGKFNAKQALEIVRLYPVAPWVKWSKGFEANFSDPQTAEEREIKALMERRRAETMTRLQQEVFAQRKRLADAERALAAKTTKAATESKRIAESKIERALARLSDLERTEPKASDSRIFPMMFTPVIVMREGQFSYELARYHLRQPGQPAAIDNKFPGLYNARRDNLEKFWRNQFGATHALMVVSSFYENVDRDGKNHVLHFNPRPAQDMLVACLYSEWSDGQGTAFTSFAAITDEPPPEIAAVGHDRCIVNLKPENVERWLTPQGRSKAELQALLEDKQRPYYEHELLAA